MSERMRVRAARAISSKVERNPSSQSKSMGLSSATAKWRTSSLGVGAASSTRQHRSTVDEKKSSRPKRPHDEASPGGAGGSDGGGGAAMAASTSRTRLRRAFSSSSLATRRSSTSPRRTQTSVLSVDGRFFVVLRRRWTRHRSSSAPRRKCACRKRAPAPSGVFTKSYMFIIRANDVQFRCLKYRGQTSSAKRFVSAITISSPASDQAICSSCSMRASCCTKGGTGPLGGELLLLGGCGPFGWPLGGGGSPPDGLMRGGPSIYPGCAVAFWSSGAIDARTRRRSLFAGVVRCLYDDRAVSNCIYAAQGSHKGSTAPSRKNRVRVRVL